MASEGHILSRRQIAAHGRDRYPTVAAQFKKVLDEAGELAEALITDDHVPATIEVRREYADVGLALFALGDKLGLDLVGEMRKLVEADQRSFIREGLAKDG